VVWWVLSGIALLLFFLILSKAGHIEPRPSIPKVYSISKISSFVRFQLLNSNPFFCAATLP
jgi:hypothetical protein